LVLLHGVLAFIPSEIYVIKAKEGGNSSQSVKFPTSFPLPISPEFPGEIWQIEMVEGGYTFRQEVWMSAIQSPEIWAVNDAGDHFHTIKAPYANVVASFNLEKSDRVLLETAYGSENQWWEIIPVPIDSHHSWSRLYGKSRFNRQLLCRHHSVV